MDKSILFKIPYGIYLISSDFGGCIVNTVIQITDDLISVSINKNSHTANVIKEKGKCIISSLSDKVSKETIKHFSMTSGYNVNKFNDFKHEEKEGIPYISENVVCNIECSVENIIDADTHYLFVLRFNSIFNVDKTKNLMTYEKYRDNKEAWICSICHYVYDGNIPFAMLLDDYVCPICGRKKEVFLKSS